MLWDESRPPVIVVGSANQDYIVRVAAPPEIGETVLAHSLLNQPGGKGANQAVAAARLRCNVTFIGSVGDDADGAWLLRQLRAEGVDTDVVEIVRGQRTGLALVTVFDSGDNSIVVVPGTNFSLNADRVAQSVRTAGNRAKGAVIVLQGELLTDVIEGTITAAEELGSRLILNLAPYRPIKAELLALADPLVLNESEAEALTSTRVDSVDAALRVAEQIAADVRSVVITLGAQGACWASSEGSLHVAAPCVGEVVDTTGAGDAFVGALSACLARGAGLHEAVEFSVRAGSFAVGTLGAQSSYPTLADLGIG